MKGIEEILKNAKSFSDVCRYLKYPPNGWGIEKVKKLFISYDIEFPNLKKNRPRKYETITKICPVCGEKFKTKKNHEREKIVCSRSCSNTYFRSAEDNPNWKGVGLRNLRRIKTTIDKCDLCGWDEHPEILEIHHKDRNRENNEIDNILFLCPNCHSWEHYKNKDGPYHQMN